MIEMVHLSTTLWHEKSCDKSRGCCVCKFKYTAKEPLEKLFGTVGDDCVMGHWFTSNSHYHITVKKIVRMGK